MKRADLLARNRAQLDFYNEVRSSLESATKSPLVNRWGVRTAKCAAYRKKRRLWKTAIVIAIFVLVTSFVLAYKLFRTSGGRGPRLRRDLHGCEEGKRCWSAGRKLLSDSNESSYYPEEVFTEDQLKEGAIALHIIGVAYMFLGLALVCDEFFVPALHIISRILNISDDVAGATFMAAGGSAPELFTSIIGVFIATSNVGFGTIVGSAVFNVLFVIGMCVVFSKTVLRLTWWPLLRDCCFYIVALALLITFFENDRIEWWESLVLFIVYILYVCFMYFNGKVEKWVKSKLNDSRRTSTITPITAFKLQEDCNDSLNGSFRHGPIKLLIHALDPVSPDPIDAKIKFYTKRFAPSLTPIDTDSVAVNTNAVDTVDTVVVLDDKKHSGVTAILKKAVTEDMSKIRNNFKKQDRVENSIDSFKHLRSPVHNESADPYDRPLNLPLGDLDSTTMTTVTNSTCDGSSNGDSGKEALVNDIDTNHLSPPTTRNQRSSTTTVDSFVTAGKSQISVRSCPYTVDTSEQAPGKRPQSEMEWQRDVFNHTEDPPHPFTPTSNEKKVPNIKTIVQAKRMFSRSADGTPRLALPGSRPASRIGSLYHRGLRPDFSVEKEEVTHATDDEADNVNTPPDEDEDEPPLDMSWPGTMGARIFYVIKFPLLAFMCITLPDVRRPKLWKLFPITFLLSIIWIAGLTFLMVWWTETIGNTIGIPIEVMGLTFLAAGTSVPDLITSVVVARQGFGDMAVSSSIGSNIFDVTVGLPVPWLIKSLITSMEPVIVESQGLFCSTFMLFCMLICVVATIAANRWMMSKSLGIVMFSLYLIFLCITLLMLYPETNPYIPCYLD